MAEDSLPTASEADSSTATSSAIAAIAPSGLKGWQTLAAAVGGGLPVALSETNNVIDSSMRLLAGQAG